MKVKIVVYVIVFSGFLMSSCNNSEQVGKIKRTGRDTTYVDTTYYGIHIMELKDSTYTMHDIINPGILDSAIRMVNERADREWMESSLEYYQKMGFYKNYSAVSPKQLADSVIKWRCKYLLKNTIIELAILGDPRKLSKDLASQINVSVDSTDTRIKKYNGEFSPSFPTSESHLVRYDTKRVWLGQFEYEAMNENNEYVKILNALSNISNGAFAPSEIKQTGEQGGITINFKLKGAPIIMKAEGKLDWLDMNILKDINKMIRETGLQFYIYDLRDGTFLVVCLTAEERKNLSKEKNWNLTN